MQSKLFILNYQNNNLINIDTVVFEIIEKISFFIINQFQECVFAAQGDF